MLKKIEWLEHPEETAKALVNIKYLPPDKKEIVLKKIQEFREYLKAQRVKM